MDHPLRPVSFSDLPGWYSDDPSALFGALERCRVHVASVKPYRTGSLGISVADLMPAYEAASRFTPRGPSASRAFFEDYFKPFRIGADGFVTGFYEPEVSVCKEPDTIFRFPFYRRPSDLIDVGTDNRPPEMDGAFVFGRAQNSKVSEYPDRRAIDEGFLEGRSLEIAYADSKVDVFFAHVQGAARLVYPDGKTRRITYSAKSGHPFSAIGRLLIDRGEIGRETVSMGSIRRWLADHPDEADEVLWHNRSYIFFREEAEGDPLLGPVAAAKVQLVPGRSLAVDKTIHTFGMPFFVHSPTLTRLDGGEPFGRLMLSLDTGSAILGPARGDIFTGSGAEAGDAAGGIRDAASMFILIPKAAAGRYSDD